MAMTPRGDVLLAAGFNGPRRLIRLGSDGSPELPPYPWLVHPKSGDVYVLSGPEKTIPRWEGAYFWQSATLLKFSSDGQELARLDLPVPFIQKKADVNETKNGERKSAAFQQKALDRNLWRQMPGNGFRILDEEWKTILRGSSHQSRPGKSPEECLGRQPQRACSVHLRIRRGVSRQRWLVETSKIR